VSDPAPLRRRPSGGFGQAVRKFEFLLLSALFLAVVCIGLVQIGMRNLADTSLPWADPAMRAAVLWITMLAGVLASGSAQHIRIDALLGRIPAGIRPWVDRLVLLATALICVTLAAASADIIRLEFELGRAGDHSGRLRSDGLALHVPGDAAPRSRRFARRNGGVALRCCSWSCSVLRCWACRCSRSSRSVR
jgi:hypothetical protein